MAAGPISTIDLTPPAFSEGLADWSRGDGLPNGASYEGDATSRLVDDPDFGRCLELRKFECLQRLRYMGEMPVRPGAVIEVRARLRAVSGALPAARIAVRPGGRGGRALTDLPGEGPLVALAAHGAVVDLAVTFARSDAPGAERVALVWDERVLYAHVGIDLVGPCGGVVRIENLQARELSAGHVATPGFAREPAHAPGR